MQFNRFNLNISASLFVELRKELAAMNVRLTMYIGLYIRAKQHDWQGHVSVVYIMLLCHTTTIMMVSAAYAAVG